MSRSMLFRGPGLLLIALIAVAAAAIASRGGGQSHAQSAPLVTRTPAPTVVPTATPLPTPAPTPHPGRTHGAAAGYAVHISWQRTFVDPWWRTRGSLDRVRLDQSKSRHTLDVFLEVTLQHRGNRIIRYAHRNFFAITSTGQIYPTISVGRGFRPLTWGRLPRTGATTGWIHLRLPLQSMMVTVVWNNHNRLRTPRPFLQLQVNQRGSASPARRKP